MNINLVFHYRVYIITVICVRAAVSKARETFLYMFICATNIYIYIYIYARARTHARTHTWGARGGAVGSGTVLQAGRSRVRFPMVSLEFFHSYKPSGRTMALGLTRPLSEISIRNISWMGKGCRCVGLTNLPPSCTHCHEI